MTSLSRFVQDSVIVVRFLETECVGSLEFAKTSLCTTLSRSHTSVVMTNFIRMLMRNVFANVFKSDAVMWWAVIFRTISLATCGVGTKAPSHSGLKKSHNEPLRAAAKPPRATSRRKKSEPLSAFRHWPGPRQWKWSGGKSCRRGQNTQD